MAVLLALAGWSAIALTAGLITGTPAARSFGAIGVVVFFGFAFLLDQYRGFRERQAAWRGEDDLSGGAPDGALRHVWDAPSGPSRIDDFDSIEFEWRDER